jgi:hypothetical protein
VGGAERQTRTDGGTKTSTPEVAQACPTDSGERDGRHPKTDDSKRTEPPQASWTLLSRRT